MILFDAEWRKSCSIRKCNISHVDGFIKAHYLHKRPAIVMLCLVAEKERKPIGCDVFSLPPKEVDKRYGGKTWELSRIYMLDEIPKNSETWLICKSLKYIKKNNKDVRFLISYADPSVGHSGIIYKAANWKCDGKTDEGRKTPRCDYVDEITGKKYGRRGNVPKNANIVRSPRVSKYRYFLKLS